MKAEWKGNSDASGKMTWGAATGLEHMTGCRVSKSKGEHHAYVVLGAAL